MPGRKMPTVKEAGDWVLVSLQDLGGEAKFGFIDYRVMKLLADWGVPEVELDRKIKHTRTTSLGLKTSAARTELRKSGLLEYAKGHWRLTASGETRANFRRQELGLGRPKAPVVNNLARDAGIKTDALQVLRDNDVSEEVLEKFLELLVAGNSVRPVPSPITPSPNLKVEKAAIDFIRSVEKEKGWHTTRTNNPGFDLYQTESGRRNGKVTVWCEVKSLSGRFSSVSLTHTEFEKAQECGDAYWLYIVENAQSAKPTLLRIQNPAGKAERFTYGSRWRNGAEK